MKELSLHILDIVQNSIRAEASKVKVLIWEDPINNWLTIEVEDNGKGMSKTIKEQVTNPFTTTRTLRKVGLGLPFFDQLCKECGGELKIKSEEGVGTSIIGTFQYDHIDRLPIGDMGSTMEALICAKPDIHFTYVHRYGEKEFICDTKEVLEILDGLPINHPDILQWIRLYIQNNCNDLYEI